MSTPAEVERYAPDILIIDGDERIDFAPDPVGYWVKHSDYEALAQRLADIQEAGRLMESFNRDAENMLRLKAETAERSLAAIQAECEGLRRRIADSPKGIARIQFARDATGFYATQWEVEGTSIDRKRVAIVVLESGEGDGRGC